MRLLLSTYYRYLQRKKINIADKAGIPLPDGIRKLEKRKYLTYDGLKNWDELTMQDKLALNIEIS